jgi:hypothetical protein
LEEGTDPAKPVLGLPGHALDSFFREVVRMNQWAPESGTEEEAQLGELMLVYPISKKPLFWGFLLATFLGGLGVAVLLIVLERLIADWTKDVFGSALFFAFGVFLLWGGRAIWRKTKLLCHVKVNVYTGGLSYHKNNTCVTCRWNQILDVRGGATHYYEQVSLNGLIPIESRRLSHTNHLLTVRRHDGVELVFTGELQNVTELFRIIQQRGGQELTSENP